MSATDKRIYVLDTNVLLHDPAALFRFGKHDIYIPMIVLEELDATKKGLSEIARNARQTSRFLDDAIGTADGAEISAGLDLPAPATTAGSEPTGKLFLQTFASDFDRVAGAVAPSPDNNILTTINRLAGEYPERTYILVSKDINLRIKARVTGISAEDYASDKVLDDIDLLHPGWDAVAAGEWPDAPDDLKCWHEDDCNFYSVDQGAVDNLTNNEFLSVTAANESESDLELRLVAFRDGRAIFRQVTDFRSSRHSVWGIEARNREQNFALNLLMDPEVEFVSLLGVAGTGKTLLALAAGLTQCLDARRYREIIVTRVTIPVGEDIGYLPGTEEEKMEPWMGALMDNLEVLTGGTEGGEWGKAASQDLIRSRIKIRSVNFMRGRTFLNRYLIIDEAQNLTPKQLKTLITRAGPDSKVICLGNVGQIDTPYLSETTSGLTYVIDRFRGWAHSGHVTLARGERSRLADYASQHL